MYVRARPRPEAQLSTCLLTVKDEDIDGITEIGASREKYYLGYVLLEQLSIATSVSCFQLSNLLAMVIYKKRLIVHIQCLLRVDGSIVAGVF